MTADVRTRARLEDLVESLGGTVTVSSKPTHSEGKHGYPHVLVTMGRKTFETHRATLQLCTGDVERWLRQEGL